MKKTLEELSASFKGKGSAESESVLVDNNGDKTEGYVSVWSNKADATKIISRCKNSIIRYEELGDGVQLFIDRKAFRGIVYAFRSVKDKKDKKKSNSTFPVKKRE